MFKNLDLLLKRTMQQSPLMQKRAEYLFECMVHEMKRKSNRKESCEDKLDIHFTIINRYCATLNNMVATQSFASIHDEIAFYKTVRPKFIAEKLFCGLLSHAVLFKTSTTDTELLTKFWMKELQRLDKFCRENQQFWTYYTSNQTDKDEEWFTRNSAEKNTTMGIPMGDPTYGSSHDWLVSNLLALERYKAYVCQELTLLHP